MAKRKNAMDRIAGEWLAARNVIKEFLRELCHPSAAESDLDHNAAAIIARLANHKPAILLTMESPEEKADHHA